MTKQEVADLLLRMNDDCSNVEFVEVMTPVNYKPSLESVLNDIANGFTFRIKDNRVKEVTLDLFNRVVISKNNGKTKGRINYVETDIENHEPFVVVGLNEYTLDEFNEDWQLVED